MDFVDKVLKGLEPMMMKIPEPEIIIRIINVLYKFEYFIL